ncbi:MAG: hypothetical protein QM530_09825 [Phycisphaerales bacterium]|nr:hypothetical protein [Phycisphaerales bacterium]
MKKQSLKSNLFAMEQYQVAGDKIFGGAGTPTPDVTSNKTGGADHYKSTDLADTNTTWEQDVTNNSGADMVINPNPVTDVAVTNHVFGAISIG